LVVLLPGPIGKDTKLHSVAVQTSFPGAQGGFSFVGDPITLLGRGVPGIGLGVTLISDVVSAVSDEIALVGRPAPFVFQGVIDHVNPPLTPLV
jgi:hypothetical protein